MNRILSMSNDTIKEVKCSLCDNSLSHFPIFLTEKEQDVCGRCSIPEGTAAFHNKAFEKVVQHMKFPCRFKEQGCVKELLPMDVPYHEENCDFKTVECPGKLFTCCSWQGTRNSMLLHCRETHKDLFLEDKTFKLNMNVSSCDYYVQKFLEYDETLFIVEMIHDLVSVHPKTVSFMIYHIEEEIMNLENHPYKIVLGRGKTSIIVESVTSNFSEKEWCKIALDPLMMEANNEESLIAGNIVLGKSIDAVINDTRKGFDEAFLSLLACSKCKNYVLPPLQCLCDKIICTDCAPKGKRCKCNTNASLNKIAEMLDYPCRYKEGGCNVVLKSEKMKNHLEMCPFKMEECRVCDDVVLIKDLKNHLETHTNIIIENGRMISLANEKGSVRRLIRYDNHLFLLDFFIEKYSNDIVYEWIVDAIMSKTENELFEYEIELKNNNRNIRILMVKKCLPLFSDASYCSLENNISKFLQTGNNITIKVTIYKK